MKLNIVSFNQKKMDSATLFSKLIDEVSKTTHDQVKIKTIKHNLNYLPSELKCIQCQKDCPLHYLKYIVAGIKASTDKEKIYGLTCSDDCQILHNALINEVKEEYKIDFSKGFVDKWVSSLSKQQREDILNTAEGLNCADVNCSGKGTMVLLTLNNLEDQCWRFTIGFCCQDHQKNIINMVNGLNNQFELLINKKFSKTSKICNNCYKIFDDTEVAKRCSRCKCVYYCNTTCQSKHWNSHKIACREFSDIKSIDEIS